MGCGISTLDSEDSTTNRHSNPLRRYKIVRPVADNNLGTKKLLDGGEESLNSLAKQEAEKPTVGVNGGNENHPIDEDSEEEETRDRDDHISKGPGSPSFRDYCVEPKSKLPIASKKKIVRRDPSFSEYFNDDSGESTKNEGDIFLSVPSVYFQL